MILRRIGILFLCVSGCGGLSSSTSFNYESKTCASRHYLSCFLTIPSLSGFHTGKSRVHESGSCFRQGIVEADPKHPAKYLSVGPSRGLFLPAIKVRNATKSFQTVHRMNWGRSSISNVKNAIKKGFLKFVPLGYCFQVLSGHQVPATMQQRLHSKFETVQVSKLDRSTRAEPRLISMFAKASATSSAGTAGDAKPIPAGKSASIVSSIKSI